MWTLESHIYPIVDINRRLQYAVLAGCDIADNIDVPVEWEMVADSELPVCDIDTPTAEQQANQADTQANEDVDDDGSKALAGDPQLMYTVITVAVALEEAGFSGTVYVHATPEDGLWFVHEYQADSIDDFSGPSWLNTVVGGLADSFLDNSELGSTLVTHSTQLLCGGTPVIDDPVLEAIIDRLGVIAASIE